MRSRSRPTTLLAGAVLCGLFVLRWRWPRASGPLIAVVAAAAVQVFGLADRDVAVIGPIPRGLPTPSAPTAAWDDLRALLLAAVGIAVVGFTDNVLTARAFADDEDDLDNAKQELLALAAANLAAGFSHGCPVSSSGSRTAIAASLGARTQIYSVVGATAVVATAVAGRRVLARFPSAALAAIVVFAATRLFDVGAFRRLARFRRSEAALALATVAAVLALDILYGVLASLALSVVELLSRVTRPHDAILGVVPGLAGMHDIDDHPTAREIPGLLLYRYDAPLFFANADDFRRHALAAVDSRPTPVRWFVFNTEANVEVDLTALDAVDRLRRTLARQGIEFALARVKQDLLVELRSSGLADAIGRDRMFPTLPTAVEAYRPSGTKPTPRTTPRPATGRPEAPPSMKRRPVDTDRRSDADIVEVRQETRWQIDRMAS